MLKLWWACSKPVVASAVVHQPDLEQPQNSVGHNDRGDRHLFRCKTEPHLLCDTNIVATTRRSHKHPAATPQACATIGDSCTRIAGCTKSIISYRYSLAEPAAFAVTQTEREGAHI